MTGQWGQWSIWSSCTTSCGDLGVQIRSRTCNINNRCEGEPTESQPCNRQVCPITPAGEPQWTEWTSWTQCSVSCGHGSQARYRRCQNSQGSLAFSCQGQTMDIRSCEELPCNSGNHQGSSGAQWTGWSVWGPCSVTCGPGFQSRTRACSPQSGSCDGSWQQRMACNLRECSSGGWNAWGGWSECSRLCGKGVRSRSRTCPANNCQGSYTEESFCNEHPCTDQQTLNSQWSGWSVWGPCSVTCGNGVRRRTRHCQLGNCPGLHFETSVCNNGYCSSSDDASWGGWGYWSVCSESCGQGFRRRVRKCYGGGQCPGTEYEREQCQIRPSC
ncbi:Peptidase M12B domain-containing protein [Meloidogyne graminicola]|uniref:Peptidase M12B domain-containing protein n=1 Tax=Meloidogyne graminicola TaxID=189291 RepID=A0A8S9ZDH0_9BILA|nr:Peptidase M12B domain-containing protein [Meloidogyne graminicola]